MRPTMTESSCERSDSGVQGGSLYRTSISIHCRHPSRVWPVIFPIAFRRSAQSNVLGANGLKDDVRELPDQGEARNCSTTICFRDFAEDGELYSKDVVKVATKRISGRSSLLKLIYVSDSGFDTGKIEPTGGDTFRTHPTVRSH